MWEYHDVWRWNEVTDKAVPLRENYFRLHPGTGEKVGYYFLGYWCWLDTDFGLDLQIEWYTDLYFPFAKRWAERVRNITSEEKLVFLEPIPNEVREFVNL